MSKYLNWTHTRKRILERAAQLRAHPFTRVSNEVKPWLEAVLDRAIDRLIQVQPSAGKTIYPEIRPKEDA